MTLLLLLNVKYVGLWRGAGAIRHLTTLLREENDQLILYEGVLFSLYVEFE